MKSKPFLLLCAISVILVIVRLKSGTQPEEIEVSTTNCSEDAIKSIPDITVRSIVAARCAKEKSK
ncbi:hypothetical protein MJ904_17250 [Massilia sp. MB5]|uniref:hypothetical protein n=1 Tax=unclassified Massilia TaxID=2609279 RepID=UPI00067E1DB9|nr:MULTISPECIES: hypothetical protein [unclassified Massilia]AKU21551.1 hypothetical protein ACZ75_08800 [Massilia sp. NR 4-1]UMR28853.1 hypothetical protein MJ904_17250 [Massilia sp. MB5]